VAIFSIHRNAIEIDQRPFPGIRTYSAFCCCFFNNVYTDRIELQFMPIKVLLADDSELVRRAIRRLLTDQPNITLVGETTDFAQTLERSRELRPHVIILDLHMSNDNQISPSEVRSHVERAGSRVLAISVWDDEETKVLADDYGAVKLLDKINLGTQLIPSILEIAASSAENS
jgi:two-component system response regulator DevR